MPKPLGPSWAQGWRSGKGGRGRRGPVGPSIGEQCKGATPTRAVRCIAWCPADVCARRGHAGSTHSTLQGEGPAAFEPRSGRPHSNPGAVDLDVEDQIIPVAEDADQEGVDAGRGDYRRPSRHLKDECGKFLPRLSSRGAVFCLPGYSGTTRHLGHAMSIRQASGQPMTTAPTTASGRRSPGRPQRGRRTGSGVYRPRAGNHLICHHHLAVYACNADSQHTYRPSDQC